MTKKTFIALADVVRQLTVPEPHLITPEDTEDEIANAESRYHAMGQQLMRERMISALADFCQSQNSRFDRERWLAYIYGECGPGGGKVARDA
jgi:hypothetical protein